MFFEVIQHPPTSTLSPYTTLFRSTVNDLFATSPLFQFKVPALLVKAKLVAAPTPVNAIPVRSEEHTSELQSRRDLVCRLLLEKKNFAQAATMYNYDYNLATKMYRL